MKTLIGKFFGKIGGFFILLSSKLYTPPPPPLPLEQQRTLPWLKIKGDQTLRLEYDLGPDSLVFDLGGFEGQWASDIYAKYGCQVLVFEPMPEYADLIRKRFNQNSKIKVYEFGLADTTKTAQLEIKQASSSMFSSGGETVPIKLTKASDWLADHQITKIELMKLNIEGGEYDLLDHLIATGWTAKIRDIQVQFHDFVPNAAKRMKQIQTKLAKTHQPTYQYEFVWENWRLKS